MEEERDLGQLFAVIVAAVAVGAFLLLIVMNSSDSTLLKSPDLGDAQGAPEAVETTEITEAAEEDTRVQMQELLAELSAGLDGEMGRIVGEYDAVGMSAVAFKNGEILYSYCSGYADKANDIKVNENTKFRIASISKSISAIIIMRLVEEGKIDLDADISEYLGFTVRSPRYPDVPITTRMILTHSSSITDGNAGYEQAKDLEYLLKSSSSWSYAKPGTSFCYTNFGAGIMAAIIEGSSGEHFVDHSYSSIIEPLGIDAAYTRDYIKDTDSMAVIYRGGGVSANIKTWNRTSERCHKTELGKYYYLALSDLIISAKDLAKYAMALAGDGTVEGIRLLSEDSVKQMNSVQFDGSAVWGLSLRISKDIFIPGRTLIGHNGNAYGMIGSMYYDREDKTGVVFLTNGCFTGKEDNGEYAISNAVVRAVYGMLLEKLEAKPAAEG